MIKVGEYIRTKQGDISKVKYVDEENIFLKDDVWSKNDLYEKTNVLYFDDEEIAKHSKNIIELIKVGDVVKTGINKSFLHILATEKDLKHFKKVYKNNQDLIKSIVTKEQFSNMEYKL